MSSHILVKIFNDIIQKVIFMEGLEPDLQMYLFKFTDKIVQICQGNLTIQEDFLTALFEIILQKHTQDVTGKAPPVSSAEKEAMGSFQPLTKTGENIGKAACKIWQTLKSRYFMNQSNSGLTMFIKWVTAQFNSLTEKISTVATQNKDQSFKD